MSNSGDTTPRAGRKLHEALAPVWRERKKILIVAVGLAVVTAILNFFVLDLTYKATASLLPETEKGKMGALGQFSGLAQLAGVSVSGSEISRLYPVILSSETILIPVIETKYKTVRYADSVDLVKYLDFTKPRREENLEKALTEMKGRLTTAYDAKTGSVVVTVEMEEPQLAADVLNGIIDQLDLFMRQKRITSASEQAKWISSRLVEVERELRSAEDALKVFRERNRKVSDSPELVLVQERLLREIKVKSTVYEELKKQYELSKIEEIKNTTIVNVLDAARPPVKKEHPKRATNTVIAFILGLMGMGAWYSLKPVYEGRVRAFMAGVKQN
jgi:uncharacterized protein involved in exopolysaccharide biosynthesis